MKVSIRTCLNVLRLFGEADELDVPKNIERLEISHPSKINTLAVFRFKFRRYALLFDDTAEDDVQYIELELMRALPVTDGELLENPQHVGSYGMPYEGKDCYLYILQSRRQRLDVYLANTYPEYSRSSWQKQIKAGAIRVDGAEVLSPKFEVNDDSDIQVDVPAKQTHEEKNLPIVYIDDDVIVVDKPAGILTHRKNELDEEFTVSDFFSRFAREEFDDERPAVVHRLDRDTSGIIIGARTLAAYEHLKAQFAGRHAQKTYAAVVIGHFDTDVFAIDLPIARHRTKPGSFRVDAEGKSAQTKVTQIHTNGTYSLLKLEPKTGRTHQLRVHMAHLGHPVYGDRLYGKAADRLYLHAHELTLTTPDGSTRTFTSPIPDSFNTLVSDEAR